MQEPKSRPNVRKKTKKHSLSHNAPWCYCVRVWFVRVRVRSDSARKEMLNMFLRQKNNKSIQGRESKRDLQNNNHKYSQLQRWEREKKKKKKKQRGTIKKAKNIDRWGGGGHKNMEQLCRGEGVLAF